MQFKAFKDLPVVKPATAGRDFQDTLLKRTTQTKEESERLYNILGSYEMTDAQVEEAQAAYNLKHEIEPTVQV